MGSWRGPSLRASSTTCSRLCRSSSISRRPSARLWSRTCGCSSSGSRSRSRFCLSSRLRSCLPATWATFGSRCRGGCRSWRGSRRRGSSSRFAARTSNSCPSSTCRSRRWRSATSSASARATARMCLWRRRRGDATTRGGGSTLPLPSSSGSSTGAGSPLRCGRC
eukprot:Amastigsp_a676942_18.p4 type:complete len:165 gc:universal Amastigsp_a676942_18:1261-767(-)